MKWFILGMMAWAMVGVMGCDDAKPYDYRADLPELSSTPKSSYEAWACAIQNDNVDDAVFYMTGATLEKRYEIAMEATELYKQVGEIEELIEVEEEGNTANLVLETGTVLVFTKEDELWKLNVRKTGNYQQAGAAPSAMSQAMPAAPSVRQSRPRQTVRGLPPEEVYAAWCDAIARIEPREAITYMTGLSDEENRQVVMTICEEHVNGAPLDKIVSMSKQGDCTVLQLDSGTALVLRQVNGQWKIDFKATVEREL